MSQEGLTILSNGLVKIHTHRNSLLQKTIEGRVAFSDINFSQQDLESILGKSMPHLGNAVLSLLFSYPNFFTHWHENKKIEAVDYLFKPDEPEPEYF